MTTTEATNTTGRDTHTPVLEVLKYYDTFPNWLIGGLVLVFALTFVLNVQAGRALYKARRLKPAQRVLLFNLAISDAGAGIVNVYHILIAKFYTTFTVECLIRYGLVIQLMTVTLAFISLMSADRVVAVVAAFHYERLVTTRRLWRVSASVWVLSVLFPLAGLSGVDVQGERHCVFQLFLPRYSLVMYGAASLVLIGGIVALNLFTLATAQRHIRLISATMVGEGAGDRVSAMNHKAAVTSLIIVVPFLLLCTPQYVLMLLMAVDEGLRESLDGLLAISVTLGLIVANSLLNPFIYLWRSAEVRHEVLRAFRRH